MDAVVVAVLVVKLVAVAVEFIEQHPQQARPSMLLLASKAKAMLFLSYLTIKITRSTVSGLILFSTQDGRGEYLDAQASLSRRRKEH